ncbi:MAG: threonine-phosphate decarboxylase CobD [Pseudomonadota bacterium]
MTVSNAGKVGNEWDLVHGGALDSMRKAFPEVDEPWLDLSTGINPFPYPWSLPMNSYAEHLPTRELDAACREAMADTIGTDSNKLLLGPGSELLIRLLPTILAPRRVAVLAPSYGDHRGVWLAAGADVIEDPDPLRFVRDVDAVVLCNPNNPDGRVFEPELLREAQHTLASRGGFLIIDEAYTDLMPSLSLAREGGTEGLIVLRSFGKFFGLAGLRLGAMLGPEPVLQAMRNRLGTWPVSGVALGLGTRAYQDEAWQQATRQRLRTVRERLDGLLRDVGLAHRSGTDLFAYVRTDNADRCWERLARKGIYVRRFSWSREHLRIGLPANEEASRRLKQALLGE